MSHVLPAFQTRALATSGQMRVTLLLVVTELKRLPVSSSNNVILVNSHQSMFFLSSNLPQNLPERRLHANCSIRPLHSAASHTSVRHQWLEYFAIRRQPQLHHASNQQHGTTQPQDACPLFGMRAVDQQHATPRTTSALRLSTHCMFVPLAPRQLCGKVPCLRHCQLLMATPLQHHED